MAGPDVLGTMKSLSKGFEAGTGGGREPRSLPEEARHPLT